MFFRLLALLIIVPLVELALLLWLSDVTSWKITLALVIGTGFLGTYLVRRAGRSNIARIRAELAAGHLPADALVDGLLILIGGVLLLTPGLLTDLCGLLLLIPPVRLLVKVRLALWFKQRLIVGTGFHGQASPTRDDVFETKATRSSSSRVYPDSINPPE